MTLWILHPSCHRNNSISTINFLCQRCQAGEIHWSSVHNVSFPCDFGHKLERWLSSFKLPKLTCTRNVQIACWFFLRNMLLSSSSYQRTLDSRTRATSGRDLSQSFFADSQKIDIRKASLYFFFSKKLALLSLLKEVKPSPGRKIIKPPTLENFFPPSRRYR